MVTDSTILVAGATDGDRSSLAAYVAAAGYAVAEGDAHNAPALARAVHPLAVLFDVTHLTPDMATALVLALRSATPRPLLAVVAADDYQAGPAMLDAGADDFLRRPIAVPELRARLNAHLRGRS